MAITNGTINRLNQLSSILSSVGNAVVDNIQNESDKRIANASSLISTYYTDSNTGRVAETLNSSTKENLQKNMQKLQKEIGELDITGARGKIAGLDGFKDSEVANALNTFKNNSGTYLATSYIQGMGALEQQYKTNTYNGITNYLNNKYSTYATDAKQTGDVMNAQKNMDTIFDNMTIGDLISSGYLTSDNQEDADALLQQFKKEKKSTWRATSILYANEMKNSKIESDFTNSLNNTFTIKHASDTFYETVKKTDEEGNEVEEKLDTFSGTNSYNKSMEIYDDLYTSNNMSIADPNGVYKSSSRAGSIQLWTYASDAFLYNYGINSATNPDWIEGDIEQNLRTWGEDFLSNCAGLTDDEKSIMLENWISSNIDTTTGQIKIDGTVATALAESAKDSMRKYAKFVEEVPVSTFDGKTAEDIIASMEEYKLDKNNSYDLQLMTNYMSAKWGFTVEATDLEYADELSTYKEQLASIPHTSFSAYSYGSISLDGETVSSQYYSEIENLYNQFLADNGLEKTTEEYKFGFFRAMNNAIASSTMELPKDKVSSLKEASETMTYDEYVAYCKNLQMGGELPSLYAYMQALSYAPVTEYKEEQTKVETKLGEQLKKNLGDEGYDYYMKGIDMYPGIRSAIGEALNKFGGDWEGKEFQAWLDDYANNLTNAYSAEFNEKRFNEIMTEVMGLDSSTSSKVSDIIGQDSRNTFYQWKQGNYDGIIDDSAVGKAVATLTSTPNADYETVREIVYKELYPNGEGFNKASKAEKSNVLAHMEIATLNVEEQRRVETSFGAYFGSSSVTPVQFEDAKQAYLISTGEGTLVVWNSSIEENTYMVGLLRPEISIDNFDKNKGGNRTLLTSDDITSSKQYRRTVKGGLDIRSVGVGEKYTLNMHTGEYRTPAMDKTAEWVQQNKYANPSDVVSYLKENLDDIDDVETELIAQVESIGFLADKYNDPKKAIQVLVAKIKEDNGVTEPKKRDYVTVGADRGFFECLDSIGYGKGNN